MAQYDSIGSQYDVVKKTTFNKLEMFNVRQAVEPFFRQFNRASVLDLGCGTGFYSDLLLSWGAGSLVGVDVSETMLQAARARLEKGEYRDRARFVQGDAAEPRSYGPPPSASLAGPQEEEKGEAFDMVVAVWCLNYANDLASLTAMFRTVAQNLKPSGVLVAILPPPTDDVAAWAASLKQSVLRTTGVMVEYPRRLDNGLGFQTHVHGYLPPGASPPEGQPATAGTTVDFFAYHMKKSLFEEAAPAAGMTGQLQWRLPDVLTDARRPELEMEGSEQEDGWRLLQKTLQETPQMSMLTVFKS